MTQSRLHRVTIGKKDVDSRLDRTLADKVPALSRTRIKRLIQTGLVEVNTKKITITVPAPTKAEPQPQSIPLKIIYEDDNLIVIDKPPGLVVHPAPGNPDQTLVNALLAHCGESIAGVGGVRRPGIVHRIDKGTSGLLVAAKNDSAHQHLATLFATHQIERAYKAIVAGVPNLARGKITENIGRNPKNRKKMAVV
ncbi:MAG: RluA family pseudouridine synthase, partial [Candidatus Poribacteria bacterium]|nr:RluA family pseudouridine synthase [Candidatus Poribacteria bacterium]